jgi:dTDP-4-dehydrorhamnose reductase
MKKILILGASGMAGHIVYYYFQALNRFRLYNVCFRNKITEDSIILDVYNTKELTVIMKEINPDYIINCIGILIKGSNISSENAIYINAYFPHLLSKIINENNPLAKLIHISSDCVFSGHKGWYKDSDIKDALDIYGMTKNLGEIDDNHNLTIRTSIIGPEIKENGEGLFHWIFMERQKEYINGYDKSIWGGITTLELAKAMEKLIECNITGLYQLTNGEKISKYELLLLIVRQFKLKTTVRKIDGVSSDKSILPSLRDSFRYFVPSYQTMIKDLCEFMHINKETYKHYLSPPIINI